MYESTVWVEFGPYQPDIYQNGDQDEHFGMCEAPLLTPPIPVPICLLSWGQVDPVY